MVVKLIPWYIFSYDAAEGLIDEAAAEGLRKASQRP
jgi:hypothetical protein